MANKRIYHEALKGIRGGEYCRCHEVDVNYSTGYAYADNAAIGGWYLEFQCQRCHEFSQAWRPAFIEKIEQVIKLYQPESETEFERR